MKTDDSDPVETQVAAMVLRCECGVIISATSREGLVDEARLHFLATHPTVGPDIPADLILAMVEEVHA